MLTAVDILARLYAAFNRRDVDGALSLLSPNVVWANDLEGGYVYGYEGVRAYWSRQLNESHVTAEPIGYSISDDGSVDVEVRLTSRDATGNAVYERTGWHIFRLEDGLIANFEVR